VIPIGVVTGVATGTIILIVILIGLGNFFPGLFLFLFVIAWLAGFVINVLQSMAGDVNIDDLDIDIGIFVLIGISASVALIIFITINFFSPPAVSPFMIFFSSLVFIVIVFVFSIVRITGYLVLRLLYAVSFFRKRIQPVRYPIRVGYLPLPGLQEQLENWLELDWSRGLNNANQLLYYTQQFIPVANAIKKVLNSSTRDILLTRLAELAEFPLGRELIHFCIVSLDNQLQHRAIDGFSFLPKRWKEKWKSRSQVEFRIETQTQIACAGFWSWYEEEFMEEPNFFAEVRKLLHKTELYGIAHTIAKKKKPTDAAKFFAEVRELRHGAELYSIAKTIAKGRETYDMDTIAAWEQETNWLNVLTEPELRPGTMKALRVLRSVASDVRVSLNALTPITRSNSIVQARATLNQLIEKGEPSCHFPEWPLVKEIAERWRDILGKADGVIPEEVLRQTVSNPYEGYSGLPVLGLTFVGRTEIMRKIETHWATPGRLALLILYGHRRMGKTSILRNIENIADSNTLYVYLNMQRLSQVDHAGQLFFDFAKEVHQAANQAGLQVGPSPVEANYTTLGKGRYAFDSLLAQLDSQISGKKRLIVAIDEFEVIENLIEKKKRIDPDFLLYLRSINQDYAWLGLIFAGLHTLDEMGRDYWSAFYGQAEYLNVSYLNYNDAVRLIAQPHPYFALEYTPELRDELYRLTYGQPFLLQRLCWELVTQWNERFLQKGESTPRILMLDDLKPVITLDFYQGAGYYFEGVWSNVTENERILMQVMAQRKEGAWTRTELADIVKKNPGFANVDTLNETLKKLREHDVVVKDEKGVQFASELMRRWVAQRENKE
jgi:hypothetical protein